MTKTSFAALFSCAMLPSVVGATTVTLAFDQYGFSPLHENSYVYSNYSSYEGPGSWAFHDDSGGMVKSSIKREDGQPFDALSMDFSGQNFAFQTGSQEKLEKEGEAGARKYTYGYVQLNGYRDGIPIVSETIFKNFTSHFTFSSLFTGLTKLEVKLSDSFKNLGWSFFHEAPPRPNKIYCKDPGGWARGCEVVRIDNLALRHTPSPVPLPAALPLLLAALGSLAVASRRRKAVRPTTCR